MSGVTVEEYYSHHYDENGRLIRDDLGPLEFERSKQIISKLLPDPPGIVLDIGGGTGPYAAWLLGHGYEVHLLDPVARHVDQALDRIGAVETNRSCSARMGDARSLPYGNDIADAALLLGPLYHLQDRDDRLKALAEVHRCVKPGGLIFAAGISRFASLIDGLNLQYLGDARFADIVERDLEDGRHMNPDGNPFYFTTAYFHRPEDLAAELREVGLSEVEVIAVEGPLWGWTDFWSWWKSPELRERMLDMLETVEREPSLIGASPHLIAVGRV